MSETMIPLADLQDKFDDILKIVDETNEPVFLTVEEAERVYNDF